VAGIRWLSRTKLNSFLRVAEVLAGDDGARDPTRCDPRTDAGGLNVRRVS